MRCCCTDARTRRAFWIAAAICDAIAATSFRSPAVNVCRPVRAERCTTPNGSPPSRVLHRIGTDSISPRRYPSSAGAAHAPGSESVGSSVCSTRPEMLDRSSTATGAMASGEMPNAAIACSVPVTRSMSRIAPHSALTVSETSVRIVDAVSSSVTARPRISLIV